jgi:phage host-nuclease inhibitor protein Gam
MLTGASYPHIHKREVVATVAKTMTPADVEAIRNTANQANDIMGRLGEIDRDLAQEEIDLNEKVQELQKEVAPRMSSLREQREVLIKELVGLVEPRFSDLVRPGTKTVFLANGTFADKMSNTPKLVVEGKEEAIVAKARRIGLARFVTAKVTRTLDKNAIKKALKEAKPDVLQKLKRLKGLSLSQDRSWVITPAKTQVDIVLTRNPYKVPIVEED